MPVLISRSSSWCSEIWWTFRCLRLEAQRTASPGETGGDDSSWYTVIPYTPQYNQGQYLVFPVVAPEKGLVLAIEIAKALRC